MSESQVDFEIYRLLVIDEETLSFMGQPIKTNSDIVEVLERSVDPDKDQIVDAKIHQFKYSVREFTEFNAENVSSDQIIGLTLARSVVEEQGTIVTDVGLTIGTSTSEPPIAMTTSLFFFLERHIVAVAYNGSLMNSLTWRATLHDIFDKSARELDFRSNLRLEHIALESEILDTFRSFKILTRLRVKLQLPNPELSRYTRNLFAQMSDGGIKELLQDMKNANGLSQEPGQLPHAAAAMADAGYKQGEVTMEGTRNGKKEKIITGENAARITMVHEGLRSYIRGLETLAKSKDAKAIISGIQNEINRIIPKQDDDTRTFEADNRPERLGDS